jgi:hypothetical protein
MAAAGYQPRQDLLSAAGKPLKIRREDEGAIRDMAGRGTAWRPTLCALLALLDAPAITPGRRKRLQEGLARVTELLPLAARLRVPVLAGADVTGSIPPGGRAAGADGARTGRRAGRAGSSAPQPLPH